MTKIKKGDKVKVKDGAPEHLKSLKDMVMEVVEVSTPAIAIKMDDGMVHKWAVEGELKKVDEDMDMNSYKKDYIDTETTERRFFSSDITVEDRADKPSRTITGYAAVFNKNSENFGWFIERIAPGAFADVLQNDTVALFNHDPNYPLARNGVNLTLTEDDFGLKYHFDAPNTTIGNDLLANIRSGVIKQSSFAFTVAEEKWEEKDGKEPSIRTITKVKRLYDVSPVTYPAYPDTTVAARSLEQIKQKENQSRPKAGLTYQEARVRVLRHI